MKSLIRPPFHSKLHPFLNPGRLISRLSYGSLKIPRLITTSKLSKMPKLVVNYTLESGTKKVVAPEFLDPIDERVLPRVHLDEGDAVDDLVHHGHARVRDGDHPQPQDAGHRGHYSLQNFIGDNRVDLNLSKYLDYNCAKD